MDTDKTQADLREAGATLTIPLTGDTFTTEALASLVGQTPRVTIGGSWDRSVGRATVVKAEEREGNLILTLDYDESAAAAVREMTQINEVAHRYSIAPNPYPGGMGFTIPDAEMTDREQGLRRFKAMNLYEVHPSPHAVVEEGEE